MTTHNASLMKIYSALLLSCDMFLFLRQQMPWKSGGGPQMTFLILK